LKGVVVAVVLLVFLVRGSSLKFDFARRSFPFLLSNRAVSSEKLPRPRGRKYHWKKGVRQRTGESVVIESVCGRG
jgi:hypothetical protein